MQYFPVLFPSHYRFQAEKSEDPSNILSCRAELSSFWLKPISVDKPNGICIIDGSNCCPKEVVSRLTGITLFTTNRDKAKGGVNRYAMSKSKIIFQLCLPQTS